MNAHWICLYHLNSCLYADVLRVLTDAGSSSAAESCGVLRSLALSLFGPAGSPQAFSSATESVKVIHHWCPFQWLFFRLLALWRPIERFLPLISNTRGLEHILNQPSLATPPAPSFLLAYPAGPSFTPSFCWKWLFRLPRTTLCLPCDCAGI